MPFLPNGRLDEEKARELGLSLEYSKRPIPVIAQDSERYRELKETVTTMRQCLVPVSDKQLVFELKKLSCHCAMSNRESVDFELVLMDFAEDFADAPLDLLQKACRQYRNAPEKEYDFFPRPGRLRTFISSELYRRKWQLRRLEKLLEVAENPPPPPEPPTAEELEEQARNQREVEKMLSKLTGKKSRELSPEEERKQHALRVQASITEMLESEMITEEQAAEMRENLERNYADVFSTSRTEQVPAEETTST